MKTKGRRQSKNVEVQTSPSKNPSFSTPFQDAAVRRSDQMRARENSEVFKKMVDGMTARRTAARKADRLPRK